MEGHIKQDISGIGVYMWNGFMWLQIVSRGHGSETSDFLGGGVRLLNAQGLC